MSNAAPSSGSSGDVVVRATLESSSSCTNSLSLSTASPQVDHRGPWLVLDGDELARILGERPALGDDEHHRVADEAHDVAGEGAGAERARVQRFVVGGGREIVEGVHREDAGHACGLGGVETRDRRARVRAPHERDVQHAGKDDVVGVAPAPGEETRVFLPRDARTDESARFHLDEPGLVGGVLLGLRQLFRSWRFAPGRSVPGSLAAGYLRRGRSPRECEPNHHGTRRISTRPGWVSRIVTSIRLGRRAGAASTGMPSKSRPSACATTRPETRSSTKSSARRAW